jgi:phenylalanyl-tRNA synthetase beta subunit
MAENPEGKQLEVGQLSFVRKNVVAIDVSMKTLLSAAESHPRYQPLAKTNPVYEEMTFTLPVHTAVGEVMATIKQQSPLIRAVEYLNQYQQNTSFRITYHDPEEQVAEDKVAAARKAIAQVITKQYQATLIGGLQ